MNVTFAHLTKDKFLSNGAVWASNSNPACQKPYIQASLESCDDNYYKMIRGGKDTTFETFAKNFKLIKENYSEISLRVAYLINAWSMHRIKEDIELLQDIGVEKIQMNTIFGPVEQSFTTQNYASRKKAKETLENIVNKYPRLIENHEITHQFDIRDKSTNKDKNIDIYINDLDKDLFPFYKEGKHIKAPYDSKESYLDFLQKDALIGDNTEIILGKKYMLGNISDFQQALDKLARLYQEAPLKGAGDEGEEGAEADFGGGGGGGDFPGEEGGGEEAAFDDAGAAGGEEGGGEDLGGEEIDFEAGEEG